MSKGLSRTDPVRIVVRRDSRTLIQVICPLSCLTPFLRYGHMQKKEEAKLKRLGGDTWQEPKWMRKDTFEKLRSLDWEYGPKHGEAFEKETQAMFGVRLRVCFSYGFWCLNLSSLYNCRNLL